MRRTILFLLPIFGILFLATSSLSAQETLFGIGPKVGVYLKGNPMIGAVAEIPLSRAIYIEPGVELVFPGNSTTRLTLDGNIRYAFRVRGESYAPFLLGGIGLNTDFVTLGGESSTRSSFSANLGGGLFLNTRSDMQYWGGLKVVIGEDDSDVALQGGIVWYL